MISHLQALLLKHMILEGNIKVNRNLENNLDIKIPPIPIS